MGKYNSSEYRVKPLMELIKRDSDSFDKFIKLIVNQSLKKPEESAFFYADKEKGLKPTKDHLIRLVEYLFNNGSKFKSNIEKRQLLFKGNEEIKLLAIKEIEKNYEHLPLRAWYVFEGYTYPDIYIEGNDYIIICEGKWTEPHLTTKTTYLNRRNDGYRNQMVRHIQGALNSNKKGKNIIAFYIVDEETAKKHGYYSELESKKKEEDKFREQVKKETVKISDDEKEKIVSSYYGMITWQDIENVLGNLFKTKKDLDKNADASK